MAKIVSTGYTLQIVKSRLGVIVIPTIAEVVISPHDALLHRGRIGCRAEGKISPGVIRIRTDFLSGGIIDGYDISLQVLLKEVVLELPDRHALRPVLQPDGSAVLVVQGIQDSICRTPPPRSGSRSAGSGAPDRQSSRRSGSRLHCRQTGSQTARRWPPSAPACVPPTSGCRCRFLFKN